METKKLSIDVWSDIACPWCHIGKRRLEAALAAFPHRADVEVTWRAFELDPSAPKTQPRVPSYSERLARKYGMTVEVASSRMAQMTETAAKDGLDFRFDRIQPGNTFDAHRIVHFALSKRRQDAVKERFLTGYLSEGKAIGETEALIEMAGDAGLDRDEVRALLATDQYAEEVRADEKEAGEIGVSGVPFFVIGRYAISGAQPAEVFTKALTTAWSEISPKPQLFAEGAVCGPDGC